MACAKLHNYVIDCQLKKKKDVEGNDDDDDDDNIGVNFSVTQLIGAPLGLQYLPILPDEEFVVVRGVSMTRSAIIEVIKENN